MCCRVDSIHIQLMKPDTQRLPVHCKLGQNSGLVGQAGQVSVGLVLGHSGTNSENRIKGDEIKGRLEEQISRTDKRSRSS